MMKTFALKGSVVRALPAAIVFALAVPTFAQVVGSSGDSLAPNHAPARRTIVGVVTALDTQRKVLLVDVGIGKVSAAAYDADTEIKGELAVGKKVKIKTPMSSGSVRKATSIKVKD